MGSQMNTIRTALRDSMAVKQAILDSDSLLSAIQIAATCCVDALQKGSRIILAGNGGSAADAQHIAAEFVSRFYYDRPGLAAMALTTDTSILTAIGNDYGFDRVFQRQLEANGRAGDVFIGISTSGNSSNILLAIERARSLGIKTIGFSGQTGKMHALCEHMIAVPSGCTPRIQEAHITIGHIICEIVESEIFPQSK